MTFGMIITLLVIAANIVLIVLFFIAQSGSAGAEPETTGDGRKQIRPAKSLLWMGILTSIWALLGVYLGADALMSERNAASALLVALMLIAATAPFSFWMIIRYLRYRITWDDASIKVTGWRNNISTYRWDDLLQLAQRNHKTTVRDPIYPGITPIRIFDLELRFKDGGIVRAAPNLLGYYEFVTDAAKHRDIFAKKQPDE